MGHQGRIVAVAALLVAGCGGPANGGGGGFGDASATAGTGSGGTGTAGTGGGGIGGGGLGTPTPSIDSNLVGAWPIQSVGFFPPGSLLPDPMLSGSAATALRGDTMSLGADARFAFHAAGGSWTVAPTTAPDSTRWMVPSGQFPRKILLSYANGTSADGPIFDGPGGRFDGKFSVHFSTDNPRGVLVVFFSRTAGGKK